MGAPLKQPQNRTFDDAKLSAMVEPLTIRIERRKGSQRTPIPMPQGEDGRPPGTGLSCDEIRQIEPWLVNDWAGGGYYEITVTDSTAPTPLIMKWEPFWNPTEFPEKTPPTLAEAVANRPQSVAAPLPKPLQVVPPMANPAFPGGFPPGLPAQPAAAPAPQPFYGYGQPYYAQQAYGQSQNYQQQAWQAENERRRTEDERRRAEEERRLMDEQTRKLQQELQAAKDAALRRDYEAQLERERSAAGERTKALEGQMNELRSMMTTLASNLQTNTQKNPELDALREANRQTAERLEREQRERADERRDQQLREMIKAQQEQSQRQFDMLKAQFDQQMTALARASENRGPDPAFTMMKEIITQNSQSLKDMAHQNSLQFERMQGMMMKPADLMLLTKESQGSVEHITDRMTQYFGNVIDMQSKVMEQALALQPQGSGAADMVRDGLSSIQSLAERYVGMKQTQSQVAAQAQVEMANAQVEAMRVQAQAEQAARSPAPQVVYAPPPPREQAQLSGATNGQRKTGAPGTASPQPGPLDQTKRLGRTDMEWFGPQLLGEVLQLREGVKMYLESISATPPRLDKKTGEPQGISVQQTSAGIVMAMQMVAQHQVVVPAMVDLLGQQRYADFLDILLPAAPQPFKDDVVSDLTKQLRSIGVTGQPVPVAAPSTANDNADDDDDDDGVEVEDDSPDTDDDNDGKVAAPPKPAPKKNGQRARA